MNAKDYVKDLHSSNDGFITIAKNQKTWKQQYFNDINKINIRLNTKDTYVSQNSFINQSRRLINLNRLHSIYIDIDCYRKNLTKEAAGMADYREISFQQTRMAGSRCQMS